MTLETDNCLKVVSGTKFTHYLIMINKKCSLMNSMKVTKINIRLFYVHDKQSDFIYFLEIYYFLNEGKA